MTQQRAGTQDKPIPASKTTPVLIYVPGLGRSSDNTADSIAEVLATALDHDDPDQGFSVKTSPDVVAPTGLTVSKTIHDASGAEVMQLFQFDYRSLLDASATPFAPSVGPGAVRSAYFTVRAAVLLLFALRRPAKSRRTKVQLGVGLGALTLMIFAVLVALTAAVATLDLSWLDKRVPNWAWLDVVGSTWTKIFGPEDDLATWTKTVTAFGVVITLSWPVIRKKALAGAALTECLMRFVHNDDQLAADITKRLYGAVNRLTDAGWKGPIHLLGYSFGSLVIYEAMFPRATDLQNKKPAQAITSMATIGCPLDLVRLYVPTYTEQGREEARTGLQWVNVFNQADIFASNLKDGDDKSDGAGTLQVGNCVPESHQYTNQTLGFGHLLATGHVHARYWRGPGRANCLAPIVPTWTSRAATAEKTATGGRLKDR